MAKSSRRHSDKRPSSSSGSSSTASYKSAGSNDTRSTAPTSVSSGSRPYVKAGRAYTAPPPPRQPQPATYAQEEDLSPSTSCYPRSSTDTYDSEACSGLDLDGLDGDVDMLDAGSYDTVMTSSEDYIPPLPVYRRDVVDPDVRPTTPHDFAKLFPSMNRLSIRHDDLTPDGNMNLRVDTVVTAGARRRPLTMQLFHLRMHDLARREFSLRRYCRDSGREVCNSKRKYLEPSVAQQQQQKEAKEQAPQQAQDGSRPNLQRSVSSAFKFKRTNSGGSLFGGSPKSSPQKSSKSSHKSSSSKKSEKRPTSSSSSCDAGDDSSLNDYFARSLALDPARQHKARPVPSNTIKLEFSNYARVDVSRRGSAANKRYEFDWWGHRYQWKRVADKNLGGVVSFHLLRDDGTTPVAHIVPETRTPSQVQQDESAGGWVPPCYMWIADASLIDALTDVADVVVATGLMALVDDCIKERWQTRKPTVHRFPVPLTGRTVDVDYAKPKAFVQQVFHRRGSDQHHHHGHSSPLRFASPISAY